MIDCNGSNIIAYSPVIFGELLLEFHHQNPNESQVQSLLHPILTLLHITDLPRTFVTSTVNIQVVMDKLTSK